MFLKNFKIAHKLSFAFGLVIIFVLGLLSYIYINFNGQSKAIDLNIESYNIIRKSDQILISLLNMETGARGFALTGKDEFLEPFNKGKADIGVQIAELSNYTSENPLQQTRISKLKSDLEAWLKYQNGTIIEGRQQVNSGTLKLDDLVKEAQKGIGKDYMDSMRVSLDDITTEEGSILDVRKSNLESMQKLTVLVILVGAVAVIFVSIFIGFLLARMVVEPVTTVTNTFKEISEGDVDLGVRLNTDSKDELGAMSRYFNTFMCRLAEIITENRNQSWIKSGHAELTENINGESDISVLANKVVNYISKYIDAKIGAIYIKNEDDNFKLVGSYAYKKRKNLSNIVKLGEGIIGQAALEKQSMTISNIPDDYIHINTGLGEAVPKNILVVPCLNNNEVVCILELGTFNEFSAKEIEFIEQVSNGIAVAVNSAEAQNKMKELLSRTLEQAEELQTQQEELRQNNEELEEQTKALKESEAYMQSQQEELRVLNEELEERTKSLELQKKDIISKNENLIKAQKEIEQKADALELASKYKSEFLANMSHELRTPLNSIIVLSQMLAENKENSTLSEKQLEFANTINSSGEDLLKLINDILDISKVEAGKLDLNLEVVSLEDLVQYVKQSFTAIAERKDLYFDIEVEEGLDLEIMGDYQRLQQITNNLLSNAFKFTHKGGVTFSITSSKTKKSDDYNNYIDIAVKDTGIGIASEKTDLIFEAFKQSDGSTSRKYGGTGLGLSISREFARLMNGEITVKSYEGTGSTFTLTFPVEKTKTSKLPVEKMVKEEIKNVAKQEKTIVFKDDRDNIEENDKILLIIEDDKNFSNILFDLAKDREYKCVISEKGEDGVNLALKHKPDAILLDIGLPDITGWKVIEMLKQHKETKDIPVHIISGNDENSAVKTEGIAGYLEKPVSLKSLKDVFVKIESQNPAEFKKLLIVESEETSNIEAILEDKDILITTVNSGLKSLTLLENEDFDCMILDYELKDMHPLSFLMELKKRELIKFPIIIYTGKQLTREDEEKLQKYTESIIIKGARSSDRLVAEANLFLHDVDSKIEKIKIDEIKSTMEKEDSFKDKKILIVDDDMRNVFALTSVLEEKGLKIVVGRNGKEGIRRLKEDGNIDLVLMDIMMPEMDGYSAIKEIRKESRFAKTPIIAVTAKAMKEDRQKCIEAGADDYLTKPIDVPRLISLLRVWLYK